MSKTMNLRQLSQKKYAEIENIAPEMVNSLGNLEDAWDGIVYGASGNGKSNFTIMLVKELLTAMPECAAEYVSYEEGHAMTIQKRMIDEHNMLHTVGDRVRVTDHLTYEQIVKKMQGQRSAKIWVIDSLQACRFTADQCAEIKRRFVLGKKKKIVIYVSWSDGKLPAGATAKAVEYYANIKMYVDKLVMFPKSRYGGGAPYIIWEKGAKAKWGKDFKKIQKMVKDGM